MEGMKKGLGFGEYERYEENTKNRRIWKERFKKIRRIGKYGSMKKIIGYWEYKRYE